MHIPTLEDIHHAHKIVQKYAHQTPVLRNKSLDKEVAGQVHLKCENFQKVGAFKFRGASNAIFSLSDEEAQKGVATHSSGNHAQAVALAGQMRGIPAYIVMPENAPNVKVEAVKGYGARITFCEATLKAREDTLENVVKETGASFIHPYNDPRIIAGQGTAALELLDQQPDLDIILAPVGGGGLLSGTAIAASPTDIKIIGVEPEEADDAFRSFKTGTLIPLDHTETIADGLRTSLGELTFACIREHVDGIVTVSEQEIKKAMRFVWERTKIIIEASSAVPVAALLNQKIDVTEKKVGVILSGGNVDLDNLPWN
ncbi:pyridoxal-phosphate dependent enzyme [Aliifodinibius sp. S!AR15-10]|uniref:threonine ammonia-lyase n=1 Tax=Aliifodinibius sp. S!AR15-10 TaxID=2950437 RepID=UPI0028708DA7|nr:pyridoxal-phosphate dependent enzyme [Aliifodinibius sp. S!AR15-10]